jgi:DNA (cytosine-5)-methyltransferase 1
MKLLDLFCGAGGAAMGYYRAGFDEITGVDIAPQPHYPFTFVQADAMTFPLDGYDLIHASPPCQGYSIMLNLPWLRDKDYPLLIAPTLERLEATGTPYVVENVDGAKYELAAGWLCGGMFGLPIFRHRRFATNWPWFSPGHPRHEGQVRPSSPLGGRARDIVVRNQWHWSHGTAKGIGHSANWRAAAHAMGIDWMSRDELGQAIPPAYTEYLGRQFLRHA